MARVRQPALNLRFQAGRSVGVGSPFYPFVPVFGILLYCKKRLGKRPSAAEHAFTMIPPPPAQAAIPCRTGAEAPA